MLFAKPDARDRFAWLTGRPFAHRGLHGGAGIENSRSAFIAAIAAGYGIELDVRLSRDGIAVVCHDAELARLTGATGALRGLTASQLGRTRLTGSHDPIEPLAKILKAIAGRVPVLVELKTDGDAGGVARLCLSVRHALEGYRGNAAVMSFDAQVGQWFAHHAPRIARGLVVSDEDGRGFTNSLRRLLILRRARPHFLAYDIRSLPSRLAARSRRRGLPVLAWTVRTPEQHRHAGIHADQIIFENG